MNLDHDSQPFPLAVSSETCLTHIANSFSESRLSRIAHAKFELISEVPVSSTQVDFLIRATFIRTQHNNYDDDHFLPTDLNDDQILFAEFIKSPATTEMTQTIKTTYRKTQADTWFRDVNAEKLIGTGEKA